MPYSGWLDRDHVGNRQWLDRDHVGNRQLEGLYSLYLRDEQCHAILRRGWRCAQRMMSARSPLARHLRRIRDFLTSSICTEVAVILLCFPDCFLAF